MNGTQTFLRGTRKDYGKDPVVYSIFKFLCSATRNMPKIPNTDPSRGDRRRCTEKDPASGGREEIRSFIKGHEKQKQRRDIYQNGGGE